jgi:hypothetical protein
MTRLIPSLLLIAALTTLSACDAASILPTVPGATELKAPAKQGSSEDTLFKKWLTTPPGGVNGMRGTGPE